MPNGDVHSVITLAACAAASGSMAYLGYPISELACVATGFLVSLAVNPDLDINRRFPKTNPARWLWWMYWYPYSRVMKHRSAYSHIPVVGTAIRVIYLLPLIAMLVYFGLQIEYIGKIAISLAISDCIHAALDISTTSIKRFLGRRI